MRDFTAMHAVTFDRFGGPEVLRWSDRPRPRAGSTELVIRVAAAAVNPTDALMRSGQQVASMGGLEPPFIPGMEFSGWIEEVGIGSARFEPGQAVMGIVEPRRAQGGAYSEFVCVPEASVVAIPDSFNMAAASTVPMSGLTALLALEALALRPGHTLLVTGGAGAVGGYVIQLAKDAGLHVITDAKDTDRGLLQKLGTDSIVPRGEAMSEAVRTLHPGGVDGLLDAALLGKRAVDLVRDGGTAVFVRRGQEDAETRVRTHVVGVGKHVTRTELLDRLSVLLLQGKLTPRVAVRLPASQAVEAHRRLAKGGLRGRIVLEF
ncbi:NADP-dependent oxidoreductase [Variovorax guangxiensis]|uniref:NADP-dependent oxidoreductase n=1 Tax=Variovorax guangxiensis TaxID=1775474 RepID=UPI00285ED17D|nr:NADP-dependent oxidoreductase [Variovorax guangxiensis]MDR6858797.1 NADPH:quinone reductase-like Zn-dependent oxidoreductase [Variovorax guangxiensis]